MQNQAKFKSASQRELDYFISLETSTERLRLLESWASAGIGLSPLFIKGLMELRLSDEELASSFDLCVTENKAELELWIMSHFLSWNQSVAAAALRAWARCTDKILWHRLVPILSIPDLPQRIRFTILDLAPLSHGYEITKANLAVANWEDFSGTFHALLTERALQFEIQSERLLTLSKKVLSRANDANFPDQKSLFAAFAYILRHAEKELTKIMPNASKFLWSSMLISAAEQHSRRHHLFSKIEKSIAKMRDGIDLTAHLPPIWSRFDAPDIILDSLLKSQTPSTELLSGFSRRAITDSLCSGKFDPCWSDTILSHSPITSVTYVDAMASGFLTSTYNESKFSTLNAARYSASTSKLKIAADGITKITDFALTGTLGIDSCDHPIGKFFDALLDLPQSLQNDDQIWSALTSAWRAPESAQIANLSAACRKHKGLVHVAFIRLLSRMNGRDEAVLKLLDYIRSEDEILLRSVARALGKINTPRSHLELISMLTRPNSTISVQQEITSILARKDLQGLQKELRSAIQDLRLIPSADNPLNQIRDELTSMLSPTAGLTESKINSAMSPSTTESMDLDGHLSAKIPHYKSLSSEVKRALRTALFFNHTASSSQHADSIDLSPLIDMQYKAMELLYREFFEDIVSQSLQSGSIQRRLDVIGYARPIVRQMDEFESYIASLPVVREIPFFSKFKLRKMLRAICQFEPGRRFTLDGLKAFGLYFLVFGRQSCKAGLSQTLFVGTKDDAELAEFCKELHVFQDFRNRAAHEGFHPDASNDIEGIWRTTASVVKWAFRIKDAQKSATPQPAKRAS